MRHIYSCLSLVLLLSACSTHEPSSSPNSASVSPHPSVPQIPKSPAEIHCQDLQNPAYQQAVIEAINQIRQHTRQCGQHSFSAAAPLNWNHPLYRSAFAHSEDMAQHQFLGHINSAGLDFKNRLKLSQFKGHGGGENIAKGQSNLNEVMATWLTSPAHCSNLMNAKFTDYAIACSVDPSAPSKGYWTQQFGIR